MFSGRIQLPTLIICPTLIGPALAHSQQSYGSPAALPVSLYLYKYFTQPDSGVSRVEPEHPGGTNIVDEIPVDVVANVVFLHIIHGTAGIVHASAQISGMRTLVAMHVDMRATGMPTNFSYVVDTGVQVGTYARFWKLSSRDWRFEVTASEISKASRDRLALM
ncbi:hypothetical protein C8J57DRAFT_1232167 [Mycena rebaudengoi]|nr:hypothetical protein C8J57DRAFT_1232167 [Mycena rebaudengoi]